MIGFELQQVVAALLDDEAHGRGFAVEGVGGDERVVQFGLGVEAAGGGEFAFLFGLLGAGGRGGDSHGHGGPGFVFAQAESEHLVADVFAVQGQGAGQRAVVGLEPVVVPGTATSIC